jgi:hypothetical protein
MRFRIAHLLWLTACCGLAFWLLSLPLVQVDKHGTSTTSSAVLTFTETLYPVAEPFFRGVLWSAVLVAGFLWLNREQRESDQREQRPDNDKQA